MRRRFKHDRAIRKAISKAACIACLRPGPSDPCHIATFGARGFDTWWSMVPMCRSCHQEQHRIGWKALCAKNQRVAAIFKGLGWEFNEANGKWLLFNEKENQSNDDGTLEDGDRNSGGDLPCTLFGRS